MNYKPGVLLTTVLLLPACKDGDSDDVYGTDTSTGDGDGDTGDGDGDTGDGDGDIGDGDGDTGDGDGDTGDGDGDTGDGDGDTGDGDGDGDGGATPCPDLGFDGGASYYVCDCAAGADQACVPGDDGNAGTSPDQPWRSFDHARAQFPSMMAGDTIGFCRGGAVDVGSEGGWVNTNCRADNPCVIRDYLPDWATMDAPAPIIHSTTTGFDLSNPGDAQHEEGLVFLNLDLRGADGSSWGFFLFNDVDDVLMCNLSIDGFDIGVGLGGANALGPGADPDHARIILRNSRVTNNSNQGWLGVGSDSAIEYNEFHNNGFDGPAGLTHNIYLAGWGPNARVIGNDVYQNSMVNGQCASTSVVGHGTLENLLIEGNTVREDPGAAGPGCWGIAINSAYEEAELFTAMQIRNNRVIDVGNLSIGVNACTDCVIENNVVIQTAQFGQGISAPATAPGPGDATIENLSVRNNSIYFGANTGGVGISVGSEGSGHTVVSNAIASATPGGLTCVELNLPSGDYAAVDYNVCNGGTWETSAGDLAGWQGASGHGQSSLATDPGFGDPQGGDLSAASEDAAMVDAGHPQLSSSEDASGKPRDDTPDAGAFEW